MSGKSWDDLSAQERLTAEQEILKFRSLNRACREAPHGIVLEVAETLAIEQGRELTRRALEASVEQERNALEKQGR